MNIDLVLRAALRELPPALATPAAWRLVATIGAHASGYKSRRPMVRSTARGFWRIEPAHVEEVLRYTKGRYILHEAAQGLGYGIRSLERRELMEALEHNDVLGAVVARCMIPPNLEPQSGALAWQVYRTIWGAGMAPNAVPPASWEALWDGAGVLLEPFKLAA